MIFRNRECIPTILAVIFGIGASGCIGAASPQHRAPMQAHQQAPTQAFAPTANARGANFLQSNSDASACPSGQRMDTVLRLCTPKCADGSASAGGFCMQTPQNGRSCPCGQLKDRITGACTKACPNGSKPYAGACIPGM